MSDTTSVSYDTYLISEADEWERAERCQIAGVAGVDSDPPPRWLFNQPAVEVFRSASPCVKDKWIQKLQRLRRGQFVEHREIAE